MLLLTSTGDPVNVVWILGINGIVGDEVLFYCFYRFFAYFISGLDATFCDTIIGSMY